MKFNVPASAEVLVLGDGRGPLPVGAGRGQEERLGPADFGVQNRVIVNVYEQVGLHRVRQARPVAHIDVAVVHPRQHDATAEVIPQKAREAERNS